MGFIGFLRLQNIRGDLQHPQIVIEGIHRKPGCGNSGGAQSIRAFLLAGQIGGIEHEVRLLGNQQLQIDGFACSIVHQHRVLPGKSPGHGLAHGDIHRTSRGHPQVRQGRQQHRHLPGLAWNLHLRAGVIGKPDRFAGGYVLHRRRSAARQQQGAEQKNQQSLHFRFFPFR